MTRLFLSYATPDQEKAAALATVLRSTGFEPFFAPTSMRPGGFWLPRLAEEIQAADAFVLVLPTREPGPWQLLEYYEALGRKAREPRFPLIPVLLPGGSLRLPFLDQIHWLDVPDPKAPEVGDLIRAVLEGEAPPPAPELWRHLNPYRGFLAMEEADADFFFGRDREIGEILDAFASGRRGVMLVGNSGVGKSSLAEAGVVAALRRQKAPGEGAVWPSSLADSRRWAFVRVRPEGKSLQSLARAFVRFWTEAGSALRDEEADAWARRLETADLEALLTATREVFQEKLAAEPPVGFFLILNQGEELYRGGFSDEARRFSSLLGEALECPGVRLLGSLRSDHYGAFQDDAALFSRMAGVDVLPWQKPEEILPVIREPAARLGARFDTETGPEDIANDTAKAPGGLPPLSYLLEDLWTAMQKRGDGELRWDDYRRLGGVEGVLSQRLQDYLSSAAGREEQIRKLFTLRLAQVLRGREISRRLAAKNECIPEEWEHVEALASPEWRLLVTGQKSGQPTAEVAHESILRAEGPVRGWIERDLSFLEAKGKLESERLLWEEKGRSHEWLLEGVHLTDLVRKVGNRRRDLSPPDRRYLEESLRQGRFRWRLVSAIAAGIVCISLLLWSITRTDVYQAWRLLHDVPLNGRFSESVLRDWVTSLVRYGQTEKAIVIANEWSSPRGRLLGYISAELLLLGQEERAYEVYFQDLKSLDPKSIAGGSGKHFLEIIHTIANDRPRLAHLLLQQGTKNHWLPEGKRLFLLQIKFGQWRQNVDNFPELCRLIFEDATDTMEAYNLVAALPAAEVGEFIDRCTAEPIPTQLRIRLEYAAGRRDKAKDLLVLALGEDSHQVDADLAVLAIELGEEVRLRSLLLDTAREGQVHTRLRGRDRCRDIPALVELEEMGEVESILSARGCVNRINMQDILRTKRGKSLIPYLRRRMHQLSPYNIRYSPTLISIARNWVSLNEPLEAEKTLDLATKMFRSMEEPLEQINMGVATVVQLYATIGRYRKARELANEFTGPEERLGLYSFILSQMAAEEDAKIKERIKPPQRYSESRAF